MTTTKKKTNKEEKKQDVFEVLYKEPKDEKLTITVKKCFADIKDMCLQCKHRDILNVMGCEKEDCSLWNIRKVIVENG